MNAEFARELSELFPEHFTLELFTPEVWILWGLSGEGKDPLGRDIWRMCYISGTWPELRSQTETMRYIPLDFLDALKFAAYQSGWPVSIWLSAKTPRCANVSVGNVPYALVESTESEALAKALVQAAKGRQSHE